MKSEEERKIFFKIKIIYSWVMQYRYLQVIRFRHYYQLLEILSREKENVFSINLGKLIEL